MRSCWREDVQESQGPMVLRSRVPKVPGSQGPRYLKLTFKYELDSKEVHLVLLDLLLSFYLCRQTLLNYSDEILSDCDEIIILVECVLDSIQKKIKMKAMFIDLHKNLQK